MKEKTMTNENAQEKIIKFLLGYNSELTPGANKQTTLSVAQARARFRIRNVAARVLELRENGWNIFSNRFLNSEGKVKHQYILGPLPYNIQKTRKTTIFGKKLHRDVLVGRVSL